MAQPAQAVVVGGGISGLCCALRLQQLGVPAVLVEASERPGGMIGTVEKKGFLFELGPQSFLGTDPLLELVRALGLESELLTSDPKAPRYVLVRGKLHAVPMSPALLASTPLLGPVSKLRLLVEPLGRKQPGEADESVAAFVRRKFGAEILDYLAAPFVSGVYAGDPEHLSLRSAFPTIAQWEREYGSVLRGALKSRPSGGKPRPGLCTFRRGMATLPNALASKLGAAFRTEARLDSIAGGKSKGSPEFELGISQHGAAETIRTTALVLATPAYASARLLGTIGPPLASSLSGIAYAPVAVVAAGYWRKQVGHPLNGFGFLVPRTEKLRTLGTVWNSSLFTGRAPEGTVILTSFAGGATDPNLVDLADDAIAATIQSEIGRVLEITGQPVERMVWRYDRALPQYNLGHAERVAAIRDELSDLPGLFLAGNYLDGPSIGNCVEAGFRIAQSVRDYLAGG
jgi:oxygen-dependent protoporphyrinogen oxidase